jgi:hypothetical protein
MTIPRQKTERVWHDPDESPPISAKSYFQYFSGKFFLIGILLYFMIHIIMKIPISTIGIIIMLIVSALFSPILNILYQDIRIK